MMKKRRRNDQMKCLFSPQTGHALNMRCAKSYTYFSTIRKKEGKKELYCFFIFIFILYFVQIL